MYDSKYVKQKSKACVWGAESNLHLKLHLGNIGAYSRTFAERRCIRSKDTFVNTNTPFSYKTGRKHICKNTKHDFAGKLNPLSVFDSCLPGINFTNAPANNHVTLKCKMADGNLFIWFIFRFLTVIPS